MASKRICRTCGAEYEYCPGCARSAGKPEWMLLWDTEKCRSIYKMLSAYNMNLATAEEVEDLLKAHNVTNYNEFLPDIKRQLQKIVPVTKAKKQTFVDMELIKTEE